MAAEKRRQKRGRERKRQSSPFFSQNATTIHVVIKCCSEEACSELVCYKNWCLLPAKLHVAMVTWLPTQRKKNMVQDGCMVWLEPRLSFLGGEFV